MRIRLEGVAGKKFGYEHNLNVRTPNEAIRALCQLIPGFRSFLSSAHEYGVYFQLISRDEAVGYDQLTFGTSEFTLVPVVTGAFFGSSFGQILLGVVLVAFAFTGFGLLTVGAAIAPAIASLGFGLIFMGVAGLFAPGVPEEGKQEGKGSDAAISNAGTATAPEGTPIPVVYGETLVTNIPVVSSYIQDGDDVDDAKGFWMGLISEGEIEGFPNSKESDVFFNGLKATVAGVEQVEFSDGTQTTAVNGLLNNQGFHMAIGSNFPIAGGSYEDRLSESDSPNHVEIRSFNQPDADRLRIRLSIQPYYQTRTKNTNEGSSSFDYRSYTKAKDGHGGGDNPTRIKVQVFENGVEFKNETIQPDGGDELKNTILKVLEVDITNRQQPISVRIERIDRFEAPPPFTKKGGSGSRTYNWVKGNFTWLSMEVLWHEKLVYPFTSLLQCAFAAGAVTQIPAITALVRGRKLPIVARDLSITYEYSRNPANVVLDLLTNPRYGSGHRSFTTNAPLHQPIYQAGVRFSDIDLASFRLAQKYCDKHDITFDATISGDADTIELLRSITSTFQGQLVYAGGFVTIVIDDEVVDSDISNYRLFTEANVIQESSSEGVTDPCFTYEGTAKKARTTAVQVSYIDKTNFYKEAKTLVEDRDAMQKYGYNLKKIRALGCTDIEQAERLGRYTLATNLRSTETVTFSVGPEGALLLPGDVCLIGDPFKSGYFAGGRIKTSTKTDICTDRILTPQSSSTNYGNGNWYLYTYTSGGFVRRKNVSSVVADTIFINGTFANIPSSNMLWILVEETRPDDRFTRYRVQKVTEEENGRYRVIAIKYDPAKYDFVNTGTTSYSSTRMLRNRDLTPLNSNAINFKIRTTEVT